jgi:hypothetical protein
LKPANFRILILVLIALLIGIAIGYLAGRRRMEQEWQDPLGKFDAASANALASALDADPGPPAGATILKPLPLRRARLELAKFIAKDVLVARVVSFGNGSQGAELHVVVDSGAKCTIVALRGVAYGFTATGVAWPVNRTNLNFVQFEAKGITLEPGGHETINQSLHNTGTASLGVAHLDYYQCDDGSTWSRPI